MATVSVDVNVEEDYQNGDGLRKESKLWRSPFFHCRAILLVEGFFSYRIHSIWVVMALVSRQRNAPPTPCQPDTRK